MKKIFIILFNALLAVSLYSNAIAEKHYSTAEIEVVLNGITTGTTVGSIDITIDYDQSKVNFVKVTPGTLSAKATVIANNSKDMVRIGLIHPKGFDGGAKGSVMILTFKAIKGNTPLISNFHIKKIFATDLSGKALSLDISKAAIGLCK